MLTTETTTTLPPLVVALVAVVAGQTSKASEGSSHEKVAYFITACSVTFKSASYSPILRLWEKEAQCGGPLLPPCPALTKILCSRC